MSSANNLCHEAEKEIIQIITFMHISRVLHCLSIYLFKDDVRSLTSICSVVLRNMMEWEWFWSWEGYDRKWLWQAQYHWAGMKECKPESPEMINLDMS